MKQLPVFPKQNLSVRFPSMSPLALDLLGKMLVFDPNQRITGKDSTLFNSKFMFHLQFTLFYPLVFLSYS